MSITDISLAQDARDVFDPDVFVVGAPYAAMARLRREAPVSRVELEGLPPIWLVTRHEDVADISRDHERFSSAQGNTFFPLVVPDTSALLANLDPPRHSHFRGLINKGFTPRAVMRLEDRIREIAASIVGSILSDTGEFDVIESLSAEISLQVIAEVLGVPLEDRRKIFDWSNAIGSLGIEDPDYAPTPDALSKAGGAMYKYCIALLESRRDEPKDDIVSALLAAEVDGERLTIPQLNEFFLLLAVAGNETTRNTLSHGMLQLSQHPEQRRALASNPSLIPGAVEEMMRWTSPVMHFRRTLTQDLVFGGQHLREGEWAVIHYLSANRDEEVFDSPELFDITRNPNPHVAFGGGGLHFCLGAQLARLEMRVMLEELFKRTAGLEITGEPARLRSAFFHGIKRLPARTLPQGS